MDVTKILPLIPPIPADRDGNGFKALLEELKKTADHLPEDIGMPIVLAGVLSLHEVGKSNRQRIVRLEWITAGLTLGVIGLAALVWKLHPFVVVATHGG